MTLKTIVPCIAAKIEAIIMYIFAIDNMVASLNDKVNLFIYEIHNLIIQFTDNDELDL